MGQAERLQNSFPSFVRGVQYKVEVFFVATCSQGSLRARQADTIARLPQMKVHRLFPTNFTPARRKPGMSTLKNWFALWLVALACLALGQEAQEARLMRFPDIYKDKVVFMYGGDLWLASTSGGAARRITTNPGRELFPKFSPDGKWIAFTGQYDGNFNVYVMSAEGGQPKQLTFYQGSAHPLNDRMGIHDEVVTWTPDSKRIVFLSRRDATNGWIKRPFTVSIDGGLPEPLPVKEGGLTSFSPDGTKIAYNQIFRNFRTWKRYTGGLAQSITIYDLKNNSGEDVPHTDWTDTFPMWHGNAIYFSSDRGPEHQALDQREQEHHGVRHLSGGQASRIFRARRRVHGSGEGRQHSQSHANARNSREAGRVVSG